MMIFLVLSAILLAFPIVDFVRRADLRRVAVRNITRRFGEASLVVFGSLLSTAIIAAAFIVGDSFGASIRDIAQTELGPVDEVVVLSDPDDLDQATALLSHPIEGVDGVLAATQTRASLATSPNSDKTPRSEPRATIGALDFNDARAFGAHAEITGLVEAGATPGDGQIAINQNVAKELQVSQGDEIVMYAYDRELLMEVTAILPVEGLGGTNDAYVQPGLLLELASNYTGDLAAEPEGLVLLSNDGAVFDSVENSPAVQRVINDRLNEANIDFQSNSVKEGLLDEADAEGAELKTIFSTIGGFSVVAGVLLLINLFVMLAEERKTTLGVLRAVGWRRGTLVRSFALEGAIYALIASVAGAILGIGVGWVIMQVVSGIVGDSSLTIRLAVELGSLITAGSVGLVISMLAIWVTSYRISRLNIISAIRDLPAARNPKRVQINFIIGLLLMAAGAALFVLVGLAGESIEVAMVAPGMFFLGAALALERWVSADRRSLGAGIATIIWGSLIMVVLPASMTDEVDISFFLIMGLVLVAGGVAVATTAGPMLRRLLNYSSEPRVAARVGMAYPLAHRFRTAISLASFTLVIFSMVFISVMSRGFSNQVGDFTAEADLGHDIVLYTNGSAPVDAAEIQQTPGVDQVSSIIRGWTRFSSAQISGSVSDPDFWPVSGANEDVARFGGPVLEARSSQYANDTEAFVAVANDPTLAIVPDWFLTDDDDDPGLMPGDSMQMILADGSTREFSIVGVINFDAINAGAWVSEGVMRTDLAAFSSKNIHLVTTASGANPKTIASNIQGAFIANGAEADSIRALVEEEVESDIAFFRLLNGYLALGLVIGIAGLGVVLVRAIRERRRQIGMFRAMGMPRSGVRTTFLTEGVFVTMLAIITGVGLGLMVANLVLTQSSAVGESTAAALPWSNVFIISGFTIVAAMIVASIPAIQAARLRPSEALRLAD